MYKLTSEKQKIKVFRLFNSDAYFIQGDSDNLSKLSFNQRESQIKLIPIQKKGNYSRIFFFNESIIFVDSFNSKGFILDKNGKMNELPFKYHTYNEILKKGINSEVFSYNPYSIKQDIFDLNQNKVLWSSENSCIQMPLPDMFFETPTKNDLIFLNKDTGVPLWHFSLSTLSNLYPSLQANWEVWHFVGVAEGILWIDLSSDVLPNGYVMGGSLGLEADTGKIKHFLYEPIQMNKSTEGNFWLLPQYGHTIYDAEKKCLVGLFHQNYYLISLGKLEPELKMWNLESEFNNYDVNLANANNLTMDKDYIYFIGTNYSGYTRSKICVLNRQTLALDWIYDFGADFPAMLGRIEINETHLFVLDNKGTLYIFEKESV